jgi:hypothetical protein
MISDKLHTVVRAIIGPDHYPAWVSASKRYAAHDMLSGAALMAQFWSDDECYLYWLCESLRYQRSYRT